MQSGSTFNIGESTLIEDPFGHDESALPLEKFCEEVDRQVTAVDERARGGNK